MVPEVIGRHARAAGVHTFVASGREPMPPIDPSSERASGRSSAVGLRPFRVGPWEVEPSVGTLRSGDTVRHLEPKMIDVLIELAARPGEVVSKETILDAVWPDVTVGDHAFWRCIAGLRKALGDDARAPRWIETIPHRGYRLIAPVAFVARRPRSRSRWWARARDVRRACGAGIVLIALLGIALAVSRLGSRLPVTIAVETLEAIDSESRGRHVVSVDGDAMTEALRIAVGAVPGVVVVDPREHPPATLRLFGTARAEGERVVLTLRLERARGGEQRWAGRLDHGPLAFERDLALERDLAQAVAAEIAMVQPRPRRRSSPDVDRLVARGRALWGHRGGDDLFAARATFREALALDPSDARAWAGLADTESLLARRSSDRSIARFARARDAATRALRLDPSLAEAHAAVGFVALNQDWDFDTAEKAYLQALRLDPRNATAHQWYAELLAFLGRFEQALVEIERASEADPDSAIVQAVWGRLLSAAGYSSEAYRRLRIALDAGAPFAWIYNDLATVTARLGRAEESVAWRLEWLAAAGVSPEDVSALEHAIATEGLRAFWRYLLDIGGGSASRAAAHAALGDHEYALAALSEAARGRGEGPLHLAFDPAFDGLRDHPRFAALTGGVGFHAARAGSRNSSTDHSR